MTDPGLPDDPARVRHAFVPSLPDLIDASEYAAHPDGGLIRLRISVTESGVELLGDGLRPDAIEAVLAALGGGTMEQMLCG
jgi:FtsH ternary system-associated peptide